MPVRPATLAALTLLAAATSCATVPTSMKIPDETYRQAVAGAVGCPANEVVLSGQQNEVRVPELSVNELQAKTLPDWRAECRGHRFICSAAKDGPVCTEELPAVAPPGVTP